MARTVAQIIAQINAAAMANPVVADLLTDESAVAEYNAWVNTFAISQQLTEVNQDACIAEVNAALAAQTVHSIAWYVSKAMAFQFGDALVQDEDYYDPIAPVGDSSLVINAAAAVKVGDVLRIKVATAVAGVLGASSDPVMTALTAYMEQVKDAGVDLEMTTGAADNLQLAMTVYYDPLQLNADGQRLDGTENTPVQDAINAYLEAFNNSFINGQNGVLVYNALVAALRAVPGVIDVDITTAQANFGAVPYVSIIPQYVPDAGYLALDAGYFAANIVYEPYTV